VTERAGRHSGSSFSEGRTGTFFLGIGITSTTPLQRNFGSLFAYRNLFQKKKNTAKTGIVDINGKSVGSNINTSSKVSVYLIQLNNRVQKISKTCDGCHRICSYLQYKRLGFSR
jgi:hypothetical protein